VKQETKEITNVNSTFPFKAEQQSRLHHRVVLIESRSTIHIR